MGELGHLMTLQKNSNRKVSSIFISDEDENDERHESAG